MYYIQEPVVNMQQEPCREAEVVSQALFSEKIVPKEEREGWSRIASSDGYLGWVPSSSFVRRDQPYEAILKISRLAAHLYRGKEVEKGPFKTLPFGVSLAFLEEEDRHWIKVALPDDETCYVQKGDVAREPLLPEKGALALFSRRFLGLPYTWGGRSSFGYDCSGFVQMLYSQIGILLKRDAKEQVGDERFRKSAVEHLEPGDLLFFGKSSQDIQHVGLFLGANAFIHATSREGKPWIRISDLADSEWCGSSDGAYSFRAGRQLIKRF